jgi:hypothetical protein
MNQYYDAIAILMVAQELILNNKTRWFCSP